MYTYVYIHGYMYMYIYTCMWKKKRETPRATFFKINEKRQTRFTSSPPY